MAIKIKSLIQKIEDTLAEYYNFTPENRIIDFVLSKKSINSLNLKVQSRASLYLSSENDELFIGFYICQTLISKLIKEDPFQSLHSKNIDAFCALVEEISHFHLIMNRISLKRSTSHLELEWQGEIDKFLLSNLILEKQSGKNHLIQISQIFFDIAQINKHEEDLYEKANKFAAKFCYDFSKSCTQSTGFLYNIHFRDHMIKNYHAPMEEKAMYRKNLIRLTAA